MEHQGYDVSVANSAAHGISALKAEAYWLYQATSKTPAVKRFRIADEKGLEHDIENQRNWNDLVIGIQDVT